MSDPSRPTQPRTEAPPGLDTPGLVLLYGSTPNGWKVTYALQALKEAGLIPRYTVVEVYLETGEQFQPWFSKVNPNSCVSGKMPALIDNRADKTPINVFESASILLYLSRTYDKRYLLHFEDDDLEQQMLDWIFWVQGGLGPMQGQANHFVRYSGERVEYAVERYTTETKRLYAVLDEHLKDKDYIVGGKLSYADITAQPWVRCHFWAHIPLDPYPHLQAWHDRVEHLPVVQRALKVPQQDLVTRVKQDPELEKRIMDAMKARREKAEREKEESAA